MGRKQRFVVECKHCKGLRSVSTGFRVRYPNGPKDLFAENDCDCPKPSSIAVVEACEHCGETGKHWLGCSYIDLPESKNEVVH